MDFLNLDGYQENIRLILILKVLLERPAKISLYYLLNLKKKLVYYK
jgi:hypothetical protein